MADFFSGLDWGSVVKAGADILGAMNTRDAAQDAAGIAQRNADTNRAVVQQNNDRAVGMLQPRIDAGQGGAAYFRNVMAKPPTQLTPQQQIRLRDARMQNNRSLPTALRGSGRATSAALFDANNRAQAGMVQENQGRSDAAAGRLISSGDAATSTAANITSGQGGQMVNINNTAADTQANAGLVSADAGNTAVGNIASYFANAEKQAQLRGAYGTPSYSAGA